MGKCSKWPDLKEKTIKCSCLHLTATRINSHYQAAVYCSWSNFVSVLVCPASFALCSFPAFILMGKKNCSFYLVRCACEQPGVGKVQVAHQTKICQMDWLPSFRRLWSLLTNSFHSDSVEMHRCWLPHQDRSCANRFHSLAVEIVWILWVCSPGRSYQRGWLPASLLQMEDQSWRASHGLTLIAKEALATFGQGSWVVLTRAPSSTAMTQEAPGMTMEYSDTLTSPTFLETLFGERHLQPAAVQWWRLHQQSRRRVLRLLSKAATLGFFLATQSW